MGTSGDKPAKKRGRSLGCFIVLVATILTGVSVYIAECYTYQWEPKMTMRMIDAVTGKPIPGVYVIQERAFFHGGDYCLQSCPHRYDLYGATDQNGEYTFPRKFVMYGKWCCDYDGPGHSFMKLGYYQKDRSDGVIKKGGDGMVAEYRLYPYDDDYNPCDEWGNRCDLPASWWHLNCGESKECAELEQAVNKEAWNEKESHVCSKYEHYRETTINADSDLEKLKALLDEYPQLLNLRWGGVAILWRQADWGHLQICQFLIERGADLNLYDSKYHETALWTTLYREAQLKDSTSPPYVAIRNNYINIARLLIENGADVNIQATPYQYGGKGKSPLMLATEANDKAMVELLIKKGADVAAKDMENCTAYDLASPEIKKVLAAHGGEPACKKEDTPENLWVEKHIRK